MDWYKNYKSNELSQEDFDEITRSKWENVDSSFIDAVAYYEPLGMLEFQIRGSEYSFKNVPKEIYDNFKKSSSKGQYFNDVIRKKFKRMRG